MPVKLLQDVETIMQVKRGFIPPVHANLAPTNKCNLNCSFCSCRRRDKNLEINFETAKQAILHFYQIGMRAMTITGGGEPLLYPKINEIIQILAERNIRIGLVSNGICFGYLEAESFGKLTWCRISCSDEFNFLKAYIPYVEKHRNVDWSLSYVLTKRTDWDNLIKHVNFANKYDLTHIRIVSDLTDLDSAPRMDAVKDKLKEKQIDDSLVIYQGRKIYERGQKKCYVSLLRPVINADSKIYPCCGIQYARRNQDLDMPPSMAMGSIDDLQKIYGGQKYFDGSICNRCYYNEYNRILKNLMAKIRHECFI